MLFRLNRKQNLYMKSIFKKSFFLDSPLVLFLGLFLLMSSYLIYLIVSGHILMPNEYYLLEYLYTYDHGFFSRGFVGEVISWFADVVTPEIISNAIIFGSFLLIFAASLCIGFVLWQTRTDKQLQYLILGMILFLVVMPIGFRVYFRDFKFDKLVWACTFFAVLCTESSKTYWLVPLLCLLATVINPIFLFCSMILISIILLHKVLESRFAPYITVVCGLTYVLMVAQGLLGAVLQGSLGFDNEREMILFYFQRYSDPSILTEEFIRYVSGCIKDYFWTDTWEVMRFVYQAYYLDRLAWRGIILNTLFVQIPFYILLFRFWFRCIKASKDWWQKTVFLCCLISPIVLVPAIVLTAEASKFFSNNVSAQICLIIYFLVHKNEQVLRVKDEMLQRCKEHKMQTIIGATYLSMFFFAGN